MGSAAAGRPQGPPSQLTEPARQVPPRLPQHLDEIDQLRAQMIQMEGLLERAVENGARRTSQRMQELVPVPLSWMGAPRARGYRLEDYGLLFTVDVPMPNQSFIMSIQLLDQGSSRVDDIFQALHAQIQQVTDRQAREQMAQVIQRVEAQVLGSEAAVRGATTVAAPRPSPPPPDPGQMYTADVKNALVEAILDYGDKLRLAQDEWLTVAARDASAGVAGPASLDDVTTATLRIRGSDLAALREGRITRDEARKRIDIKDF
jgi:hypothetical protein